jgi:hypothetical protein
MLFISFIFSLFLINREINRDYFTFYYVGKGVAHGMDMYGDFADNKGPITYLVFTIIYFLFSDNYLLGLVLSSTFIDAMAVYFFILFLENYLNIEIFKIGFLKKIIFLVLVVPV